MFFFRFLKRLFFWRKLHPQDARYFLKVLKDIESLSVKEQIIQYDIVYHKILQKLWYGWTFWDILKRNPKEISDIQEIWRLHKLRNTLVHELDFIWKNLPEEAQKYKTQISLMLKKTSKK